MDNLIPIKNKIGAGNFIKVEPFRKDIRRTIPHKHKQYFEIIYLTGGTGEHWIDGIQYIIRPNVLFFITHMEEEATISQLFEIMARENNTSSEMAFHLMEGLLKGLLAKILSKAQMDVHRSPARTDLYSDFLALLNPNQPAKMKVAHYAAILNTTPQNLNAACRKANNQSAAEVIADFIMNEARRLLRYTNKTVSEISLSMNFGDPSHFVKFFKRMSGNTPNSYRSLK